MFFVYNWLPESIESRVHYEFNGEEYGSLEEMPPDVRKHFEDKNGSGIPDSMNAMRGEMMKWVRIGLIVFVIIVGGLIYMFWRY